MGEGRGKGRVAGVDGVGIRRAEERAYAQGAVLIFRRLATGVWEALGEVEVLPAGLPWGMRCVRVHGGSTKQHKIKNLRAEVRSGPVIRPSVPPCQAEACHKTSGRSVQWQAETVEQGTESDGRFRIGNYSDDCVAELER